MGCNESEKPFTFFLGRTQTSISHNLGLININHEVSKTVINLSISPLESFLLVLILILKSSFSNRFVSLE